MKRSFVAVTGVTMLVWAMAGCSSEVVEEPQGATSEALTACATDVAGTTGSCQSTPPAPPKPRKLPPECCGLVATIGLDLMSCAASWLPLSANAQISNMFGQCVANGVNAGLCGGIDGWSITNVIASCISSMPWTELGLPLPSWPNIPMLSCIGSLIDANGALAQCGIALFADVRFGTDSVNGQGAAQTTCVERGMWQGRITDPRRAGQSDAAEGYNICLSCCQSGGGGIQNLGACAQNCACAFEPRSPDCTQGPYRP